MRTAEDGIKAVLDYKPLTIDMFYFKNDQTHDSIKVFTISNKAEFRCLWDKRQLSIRRCL